jgi:aspartate/methionine/tyrosine aminotransferase
MKLNTFKLEDYLAKYEFTAKYLLCCSDAESFGMSDILALASPFQQDLWKNLHLSYTEIAGLPLLRETIANTLYQNLKSDNIFTFAGAEEGIFCALNTLIDATDHVIVLTPCYQSLLEIPKAKGAAVSQVALKPENNWRIDINGIQKEIRPNTKCIIINFPHNPTGQVIETEELDNLISLCKTQDIWLFSDEVYRLLGHPNKPHAPPAATRYNKAISLGVMSKAFGLAGLRVGWIACQDTDLIKRIEHLKHYTSICNSAPSEILSLIALTQKDIILNRNNNIILHNMTLLDTFFDKHSHLFEWVRPQGGCVGFVHYKGPGTAEDFCHNLLKAESTLLMPASVYSYPDNYFRIGFGRTNMPEALNRLERFLKN